MKKFKKHPKNNMAPLKQAKKRGASFIVIKKYKNHTSIVITFSRSQNKTLHGFSHYIFKQFKKHTLLLQHTLGIAMLALGICGIVISLQPFITTISPNQKIDIINKSTEKVVIKPKSLQRSIPINLSVDSIGLNTRLTTTTKNEKGELVVPERFDIAAWYDLSPTPGEIGPSVIVGHLTGYWGGAVFENLHLIPVGETVIIERADRSTANFKVDAVREFSQENFPTNEVYGNTKDAQLRLITCGGAYNYLTGKYSMNTVVYATLQF